jgi:diadenosine tetraphosphatase ApaH/serine/threonine PP2A family protein phosphatase
VGGFRYLTACTRPPTVAALNACQRRFLADLPTSRMVTLGGKRFLLVHATPRDPMDEYAPADRAFWGPRLGGLNVDYVCVGHTHQPYTLRVNDTLVLNPGSIGLSRDGDPRAAYAVLDTDTGEVEMKRVEYAVDETVIRVVESNLPATAKQMLSDIYRGGAYLAQWVKKGMANASVPAGVPLERQTLPSEVGS